MSVSVLAGPLASLAPELAKLLHNEYKLQQRVKQDVKWLHDQLETINALFNDIAKVPWHQLNEEAKVWVQKVREASYDMEDALDTFLLCVGGSEPNKPKVLIRAIGEMIKIWNKGKARRNFAVAVQDIIGRGNTERFIEELGSLPELRVLRFSIGEMNTTMQRDSLKSLLLNKLRKIRHLHIFGDFLEVDTTDWFWRAYWLPSSLHFLDCSIQFSKLPSYFSDTKGYYGLPKLSYLTLRLITMDEQDLKVLAKMPALRYLWLETRSTTVTACNIGDKGYFQKLGYFKINAMVQFEPTNEKDTSVSMHLWSGKGAMPFSSGKSNKSCKVVPYDVMPKLEVLQFYVPLGALKYNNSDCGNIGLEYLPSLREVTGWIDYDGMSAGEGDAMLDALRNACRDHPNNPTLDMLPRNKPKDNNVSAEDKEGDKHQQEVEEAYQRAHTDLRKLSPSCS